jgi:anti-sigma factor RsiW
LVEKAASIVLTEETTVEYPSDDTSEHNLQASDPDFELLEAYLDNELTETELGRLRERLASEPELAEALARMSVEYSLRRAVWQAMEPSGAGGARLADDCSRSARRIDLRRRRFKVWRLTGAAAACLMIGFLAGWIGRGNTVSAASTTDKSTPAQSRPAEPAHSNAYQVALTDEAGNITAVQKFDSLEAARNFAADVGRWQARQQAPVTESHPVNSSGL